jgi:hypothetical protein
LKIGNIAEILALGIIIATNLVLMMLLLFGIYNQIPEIVSLFSTTLSTIGVYIAGRYMAFRHNIGRIEKLAIDLLTRLKNRDNQFPESREFTTDLELEIGTRAAKMTYEYLVEKGILETKSEVRKIGGLPKQIQIVVSTWKAHLI